MILTSELEDDEIPENTGQQYRVIPCHLPAFLLDSMFKKSKGGLGTSQNERLLDDNDCNKDQSRKSSQTGAFTDIAFSLAL